MGLSSVCLSILYIHIYKTFVFRNKTALKLQRLTIQGGSKRGISLIAISTS